MDYKQIRDRMYKELWSRLDEDLTLEELDMVGHIAFNLKDEEADHIISGRHEN